MGIQAEHVEQEEKVVLVNESDQETGTQEKLKAHLEGQLHRAISVFIFNSKGELLLHQRADAKYHSGGLWTNACCSHPRPGEEVLKAAHRRLGEEMGLQCELQHAFSFIYKESLDNSLTEHELDHVFIGVTDDVPKLNLAEVQDYRYFSTEELQHKLESNPEKFTVWFKMAYPRVMKFYHDQLKSIFPGSHRVHSPDDKT